MQSTRSKALVDSRWSVRCLVCDKELSKRCVLEHLAGKHPGPGDQIHEWLWLRKHNLEESRRAREAVVPALQDVPHAPSRSTPPDGVAHPMATLPGADHATDATPLGARGS